MGRRARSSLVGARYPTRFRTHAGLIYTPKELGAVAQLGRALAWHARGHGFKSRQLHRVEGCFQEDRLAGAIPTLPASWQATRALPHPLSRFGSSYDPTPRWRNDLLALPTMRHDYVDVHRQLLLLLWDRRPHRLGTTVRNDEFMPGHHRMDSPPSTARECPVMNEASGDKRKTTADAISSGAASRRMGMPARYLAGFPWVRSSTPDSMGELDKLTIPVEVEPGFTQLARTPPSASSRASTLVKDATPAFAVQ